MILLPRDWGNRFRMMKRWTETGYWRGVPRWRWFAAKGQVGLTLGGPIFLSPFCLGAHTLLFTQPVWLFMWLVYVTFPIVLELRLRFINHDVLHTLKAAKLASVSQFCLVKIWNWKVLKIICSAGIFGSALNSEQMACLDWSQCAK